MKLDVNKEIVIPSQVDRDRERCGGQCYPCSWNENRSFTDQITKPNVPCTGLQTQFLQARMADGGTDIVGFGKEAAAIYGSVTQPGK
jgi:hypothetical protein